MYQKILARERKFVSLVRLQRIPVGANEIILLRADQLDAGIKGPIGTCLIAKYITDGRINSQTKAVVVHGSGNTVRSVKRAITALVPGVRVIAVVYAETSPTTITDLTSRDIEVVAETPREEGRVGRVATAQKLCQRKGCVLIEQHEDPAIIEIQRETFGRSTIKRLGSVTHFVAGVGTGGTLFGIGAACRQARRSTRVIAVEGVCSTLTLWHAYLRARGKGYNTERRVIQKALSKYRRAGMKTALVCHPDRAPEKWFDIEIDIPLVSAGVVGIEGLGVGNPSHLISEHLLEANEVQIVTDEQATLGVQWLESLGVKAVTSAGANFFAARELAKKLKTRGRILTIITAARPR